MRFLPAQDGVLRAHSSAIAESDLSVPFRSARGQRGYQQTLAAALNSGGMIRLEGGTATGTSRCSVCGVPYALPAFGVLDSTLLALTSFTDPSHFAGTIVAAALAPATDHSTYSFTTVPEPSVSAYLGAAIAVCLRIRALARA